MSISASEARYITGRSVPRSSYWTRYSTRPSRAVKPTRNRHFCQLTSCPSTVKLTPPGTPYWSPARTDVMRWVLKPSQCIRPT
jgi:hypothetical protein